MRTSARYTSILNNILLKHYYNSNYISGGRLYIQEPIHTLSHIPKMEKKKIIFSSLLDACVYFVPLCRGRIDLNRRWRCQDNNVTISSPSIFIALIVCDGKNFRLNPVKLKVMGRAFSHIPLVGG